MYVSTRARADVVPTHWQWWTCPGHRPVNLPCPDAQAAANAPAGPPHYAECECCQTQRKVDHARGYRCVGIPILRQRIQIAIILIRIKGHGPIQTDLNPGNVI